MLSLALFVSLFPVSVCADMPCCEPEKSDCGQCVMSQGRIPSAQDPHHSFNHPQPVPAEFSVLTVRCSDLLFSYTFQIDPQFTFHHSLKTVRLLC